MTPYEKGGDIESLFPIHHHRQGGTRADGNPYQCEMKRGPEYQASFLKEKVPPFILLLISPRPHKTGLAAIPVCKLVKGVLLLFVGLGLLTLKNAEIATLFSRLIEALHLTADSRIVHALVL